jgi:hypothetical protein
MSSKISSQGMRLCWDPMRDSDGTIAPVLALHRVTVEEVQRVFF